jgi:hypothetical protein
VPFGTTALSWLSLAAIGLSCLALVVALAAVARSRSGRARPGSASRPTARRRLAKGQALTPQELSVEVDALHQDAATALRHVAVVRYDAFGDMGGHLSWSLALLDDSGDGVVLTSIHGRSDSRAYAKNVRGWAATQQLSPEEVEAIDLARDS